MIAATSKSTFSGTALFYLLGSETYSVAAGRYRNGERYAAASWFWKNRSTEQLDEQISDLVGIKQIKGRKRTMRKDEMWDCGYLPSITVSVPSPSYSAGIPAGGNSGYTGPALTAPPSYSGTGGVQIATIPE